MDKTNADIRPVLLFYLYERLFSSYPFLMNILAEKDVNVKRKLMGGLMFIVEKDEGLNS
jgi:hypothetical protein